MDESLFTPPKRLKRKLTKKSSTFLDKSSLKKRNRRGSVIPWVEAFKFKTREEYEDSDVYKDKISNLKTRDKGGRPYKFEYNTFLALNLVFFPPGFNDP